MTAVAPGLAGPRLHDTALRCGPMEALTELHGTAGDGVLVPGPAGHVVAPDALVRHARLVLRSGQVADRDPNVERDLTPPPLADLGLRALCLGAGTPSPQAEVVWLRLGLSRRLLAACVDHLAARVVGDAALVNQQLVRAALGEAWTAHASVETGLSVLDDLDGEAVRDLHDLLTSTDRDLLVLLGAAGFTIDGPGSAAYVSELLSDVYTGGPR